MSRKQYSQINRGKTRQERRAERKPKKGRYVAEVSESSVVMPKRASVENIQPKTQAQSVMDKSIRTKKITFAIGPAGTGKTWFAAMRAAQALENREIDKIYLTRPVVEAEEQGLGYLPGELEEKYEPYLRPFSDALEEFFGTSHLQLLLKRKTIEPRPLAFIRGATLKNAWVLADEMQNATIGQHKLLLTRFGEGAKYVITGDPSQCDIPSSKSGLGDAISRFKSHDQFGVVRFGISDVVRDDIVGDIIRGYEEEPA